MAATDPGAAVGSQPAEPPFGDGNGYGGGNGYGNGYGGGNGYRYGESGDIHATSEDLVPQTDPVGAGGDPGDLTTPSRGGGRRAARQTKRRRIPAWLEIVGYVVISLTLTSLIKTFLVQMYYIPSPSMEPTTYKGDRVFVDKLSTWVGGAPARDQVIVFHDPHNWLMSSAGSTGGAINLPDVLAAVGILPDQHDDLLIKRIIGVAGDTIECKTQDGPVYRNGVALDESSFIMNGKQGMPCYNGVYKVTVPAGNLWVLGDNREHSGDSSWNYLKKGGDAGFVPTKNVVGHVVGVVSWLRADHPAGS
ncbi:signal peptidase I [Catenulispora sp. GAS73]|uniref:signal peptidase I n=1 Tax=Catenulispora sp. GAS73 TaxID=3156269 RepID=UPI00351576A4